MRPFENLTVIDLTHVLAGPFCTYQLAMLGAQVIKIEAPGAPDMMRSTGPDYALAEQDMGLHYLSQSAGKKSLSLDIKHPDGRRIFERLIEQADVLVENFRGNVMEKLQLDYHHLQSVNPALVYCSMSGFGHTGPKAHHPAYDNVIQAYSGLMAATGSAESGPYKVGPPVLDYGTGAQAALAISAALFQRQETGKGQFIDVSMLDSALMLMSSSVTETLHTGRSPAPSGNSNANNAGYGLYAAQQGMLMLGAFTPAQLGDMWQVLEQAELAEQLPLMSYQDIQYKADEHRRLLSPLIRQRSAQDWEDRFNAAGVPAARVRTLDETLATEQVKSRDLIQQVPHPATPSDAASNATSNPFGNSTSNAARNASLEIPVAAFSYAENGPEAILPPPRMSQHTEALLQELGLSVAEIDKLRPGRSYLELWSNHEPPEYRYLCTEFAQPTIMTNHCPPEASTPNLETPMQMSLRTSLMLREKNADLIGDFVINIGSHDGKSVNDPCYAFYESLGSPGLCMDAEEFPAIEKNLPWDRVQKRWAMP